MKRSWIRRGLGFLGFAVLFVGFAGLAVMMLWNALLPGIAGVTTISFWQALGLLVLSRILFGGPRGFGWGRAGFGQRVGWGYGRREWKQKMAERWQQMTPEQREQLKRQWRNRCGGGRGYGRWDAPQPEQPGSAEPTAI